MIECADGGRVEMSSGVDGRGMVDRCVAREEWQGSGSEVDVGLRVRVACHEIVIIGRMCVIGDVGWPKSSRIAWAQVAWD